MSSNNRIELVRNGRVIAVFSTARAWEMIKAGEARWLNSSQIESLREPKSDGEPLHHGERLRSERS